MNFLVRCLGISVLLYVALAGVTMFAAYFGQPMWLVGAPPSNHPWADILFLFCLIVASHWYLFPLAVAFGMLIWDKFR